MGINKVPILLLVFVFVSVLETRPSASAANKKPYAVYFGAHSHGPEPTSRDYDRVKHSHHEFLGSFIGGKETAKEAMIYSHTKHINAFSAMLAPEEADAISRHDDILSVFECQGLQLKTTRSWEFLGMEKNGVLSPDSIWKYSNLGQDIVIANIDSGVDPSAESFKDDNMGPIPSKWKGRCNDTGSSCNRKLISMRSLHHTYSRLQPNSKINFTAVDSDGHGTHTLATAGGRFVPDINILGITNGTTKGGLPNARLASYKVLHEGDADTCDILSAFDEAIHDGVDVLSISMGTLDKSDYFNDTLAMGTLHAVKNGIVPVLAASNEGPEDGCVRNLAPWVITVGGGTIDRTFISYLQLGNNQSLKICSTSCPIGPLDPHNVKGKIVILPKEEDNKCAQEIGELGAVGLVFINKIRSVPEMDVAQHSIIPSLELSSSDAKILFAYMDSTQSPMAYITPVEPEYNTKAAPSVSSYSCRGPNNITPEILKPDIIAPGTYIIAASSHKVDAENSVQYRVMQGTSMATPHVAGVVGLLKALHPDWSPAMIKSAIMTTASTLDNMNEPIKDYNGELATPFAMGAGNIHPNSASNPGLVYDLTIKDYLEFLCTVKNFTEAQLARFYEEPFKCPTSYDLLDFNYPAITVPRLSGPVTVRRVVTNVGTPGTYIANVVEPEGISLTVVPRILEFRMLGEKRFFNLTLTPKKDAMRNNYVFGKLVWNDGLHNVTSPIVVNVS